jgi:ribonucleoside-diphosphate reductase beta chain
MSEDILSSNRILNTNKTDYEVPSLFMGSPLGLIDSINVHYPQLHKLYKQMKAKDWDEMEFQFASSSLSLEFKTCSKSSYDIMIRTLAWQWESDSAASKSIIPIIAPFVTNSEVFYGWQRIADNESVHALTYSEIVKNSFDDPTVVLKEILEIKQAISRLSIIAEIFDKVLVTGSKLNLGLIKKDQAAYDDLFMFLVAMYCLEGIQFMSSFGITFAMGNSQQFTPIAMAVQKIAIDEYFVHRTWDKAVLDIELSNEYGLMAFNRNRAKVLEVINAVVQSEMDWNDYTFSEGREHPGLNKEVLNKGVLFYAKDVYEFFGFRPEEIPHTLPTKNPMMFMNDWLEIDKMQVSPMEQKSGNYVLGMVEKDLKDGEILEMDLG